VKNLLPLPVTEPGSRLSIPWHSHYAAGATLGHTNMQALWQWDLLLWDQ